MSIKHKIQRLIAVNRQQWLADLVYGYGGKNSFSWKMYGYETPKAYKRDLRVSVRER